MRIWYFLRSHVHSFTDVPYHNSKNSPVCGLCCGISFTCEMRLCTVNIPQSLINTNYNKPYSTVPYRTVTESNFSQFYLLYIQSTYVGTFVCRLSFEDMKKREIIKNKAKILSVVKKSVFEFSLFYFSQSLHYFSL